MLKKWSRRLGIGLVALAIIWCGAGVVLVLLPEPTFVPVDASTDAGSTTDDMAALASRENESGAYTEFRMRDGAVLRARQYGGDSSLTILLLHGVLTDAGPYGPLASMVRDASGAEVLTLDLRGHGMSDGDRGDVAYIGQYGDDVASVITELRRSRPQTRIVLAGHSMGGGIALRYAEERKAPAVDGYLLFAPLMGPDLPTFRHEPPEQNGSEETDAGMKVHVPRLVGLLMLNTVGIRALNGKKTLFFNVPASFPIQSYSYRAMIGMTPASHAVALEADSLPLLTIVGSDDEAFHADRFPEAIALHRNGATEIISGLNHSSVIFSAEVADVAARWLRMLGP